MILIWHAVEGRAGPCRGAFTGCRLCRRPLQDSNNGQFINCHRFADVGIWMLRVWDSAIKWREKGFVFCRIIVTWFCHFSIFELPVGAFWITLDAFGLTLGAFWVTLGNIGVHFDVFGVQLGVWEGPWEVIGSSLGSP